MKGRVLWSGGKIPTYTLKVYLNDMERTALVDSGRSQSVIRQNLVLPGQRTPQSQVLIACVHGDQLPYPVATVHLNWRGDDETITVGVIPNLGKDLIFGTDYVDFTSLLEKAGHKHVNNAWWEEAPFGASEVEARTPRIKLSRKQKREQRQEHRNLRDLRNLDPTPHTATAFTTTGDFRQAQHEDPTLKNAWHQALHPDGQSWNNKTRLLKHYSAKVFCGPSTNPTCAGAVKHAPVLPERAANPKPLPTSKEGPGGCCAGTRGNEKPADGTEEVRNGGLRRSSAGGQVGESRRSPGGEKSDVGAETSATREAQLETTSHASGEAWQPQVRSGTG
ncbi:hypothetical protein NDU88_005272 [Pleurodeles waltl]|uniref:Uncharacterized protein n=1 Tax=Pleurodeles waltl TaxID=8319 RepID=A0AAV7RL12_PLEWA|nr:hypothetical protein NDU88_005272 [Pleurodeles waltl]